MSVRSWWPSKIKIPTNSHPDVGAVALALAGPAAAVRQPMPSRTRRAGDELREHVAIGPGVHIGEILLEGAQNSRARAIANPCR